MPNLHRFVRRQRRAEMVSEIYHYHFYPHMFLYPEYDGCPNLYKAARTARDVFRLMDDEKPDRLRVVSANRLLSRMGENPVAEAMDPPWASRCCSDRFTQTAA